jgi:diguanylate cyclase (GGDEF)-like protein
VIDLRVPLLLAAMMALAFGAVLLGLRHSLAVEGGSVRRWAHGDLAVGVGLALLALHDRLHDVLTVATADVLLIGGVALQHRAIRSLLRLPARTRLELAALALAAAQAFAFWYVADVPGARALTLLALATALCASLALTVLSSPASRMPGAMLIGVAAIALIAVGAVRTAMVLGALGASAELLDWHPVQLPFYFALSVLGALANLGFVVMADARRRAELERLASLDALTGLLNRRMVLTLADKALAQSRRSGRPLALLMIDLDGFKAVNDRHGHAAGDAALARFARTAERAIRAGDVLGRYGGEEFVAVLPDTSGREAAAIAERLRAMAADDAGARDAGPACTASIGVAVAGRHGFESVDTLLKRADAALYRAKRTRNAVAADAADAAAEAA